jgi:hypothetical protein
MRRAWFFAKQKPSGSDPEAARAEGIAQKKYFNLKKLREGFVGPEGEPSAGCSEA